MTSEQEVRARVIRRLAFIVSTGRTGTGFLTRLFNEAIPGAFSLHEPKPAFRRRLRAWVARAPSAMERRRFERTRKRFLKHGDGDLYVENNYQLFAAIPMIRAAFPGAKVIHVIRDGRPVTTSFLNRYRYIRSDPITPDDFNDDHARKSWQGWTPVQKLAWYWVTVNRHIRAQGPDFVVRFEDLFGEDRTGLWNLLNFLGVDYDKEAVCALAGQRVNRNPVEFFPPYDLWPAHWQAQFWQIAQEAMEEFGYGSPDPPAPSGPLPG
jgi:hypothetical protein